MYESGMGKYGEEKTYIYICMGNVTFESEELPSNGH